MANKNRLISLPSPAQINLNLRKIQRTVVDRISALPNEILVHIVGYLPLEEAQATSILSKRWRYIWQYMLNATTTLNFNAEKYLSHSGFRRYLTIRWYVDWVDKVLKQYGDRNVKSFRVCCDVFKVFSSSIDEWIHFYMSKGVEMLELNLLEYGIGPRTDYEIYKIPHKLLGLINEFIWKHVCSDVAKPSPCACIGFKTLKVLNLKCVDMDGEVLEYMLSNCPILERVSLYFAKSLVSLRVVGPSIALKYLDIRGCEGLERVEICDTNLVSFVHYGSKIDLTLCNVPCLVEVAICQFCPGDYLQFSFSQLSGCLSQLEILKLILDLYQPFKSDPVFPIFTNLNQLDLTFDADDDCILLRLTSFLNASPCLNKLVLEMYHLTGRQSLTLKAAKCSHDCLRAVEIYGYGGRTCDLTLVKFLKESAVNLEKFVTDSAHPASRHPLGLPEDIAPVM